MRLRWSLAVAWLMMIVASLATHRVRRSGRIGRRNSQGIDALFAGKQDAAWLRQSGLLDSPQTNRSGTYRAVPKSSNERMRNNSLSETPPELDIFRDRESQQDSETEPHMRVKRISDSFSQSSQRSSKGKSAPSNIVQRRLSRKMFKRFSPEEANPADESEAEYVGFFDDDDVDVPGAYLDEELSKKRTRLEDVYPEVIDLPEEKHRKKRDKEEEGSQWQQETAEQEEEEEENAKCDEAARGQDYYYEEEKHEEEEEVNAPETSELAGRPDVEAAGDSALGLTLAVHENAKDSRLTRAKGHSVHLNKGHLEPSIEEEEQSKEADSTSGTKAQKFWGKPKRRNPVNDNKAERHNKPGSVHKTSQEKQRSKLPPDKIAKVSEAAMVNHRALRKNAQFRKVAKAVEAERNGAASREGNYDYDYEECAEEEAAEPENERLKGTKTYMVKTVPHRGAMKELQIYEERAEERADNKISDSKYKSNRNNNQKISSINARSRAVSKVKSHPSRQNLQIPAVHKNPLQVQIEPVDKTAQSIGEMRDLLGKLIVKVDNLHNLFSEMRNYKEEMNGKLTLSNFNIDSRPQSNVPYSSSSKCHVVERWSAWTNWNRCSVTCGQGKQSRSRRCLSGCSNLIRTSEERICIMPDCPETKFFGIF